MPVEFRNTQRKFRVEGRRLKKAAQEILSAVGKSQASVSILLTDDEEMSRLHERWMGDSAPTDVLSFPYTVHRQPPEVLGDVAISVETAARRCPKNLEKEIIRYLIHGMLHLSGYNHVRRADRTRMSREAKRLQEAVNLAAPRR